MKRTTGGFTLVELIIVIIIISILTAIIMLSWGGLVRSSRDHAREDDVRSWASTFDLYKSRFGAYPALPTGNTPTGDKTFCLGTFSSTNSKCGQYNSSTSTKFIAAGGSSGLLENVGKMSNGGKAPTDSGPVVNNALVGPLVYLKQSTASGTVTVTAQFINFFEGNCPSDFTNINSSLPSSIALVLSGVSGANVCALTETFSYTP